MIINEDYVRTLRGKADAYTDAIRNRPGRVMETYDALHQMLSPGVVRSLCDAWLAQEEDSAGDFSGPSDAHSASGQELKYRHNVELDEDK